MQLAVTTGTQEHTLVDLGPYRIQRVTLRHKMSNAPPLRLLVNMMENQVFGATTQLALAPPFQFLSVLEVVSPPDS